MAPEFHDRLSDIRSRKSADGLHRLPPGLHLKFDVGVDFAHAQLRSEKSSRLEQCRKDTGSEVIGITVRIGPCGASAPLANNHLLSLMSAAERRRVADLEVFHGAGLSPFSGGVQPRRQRQPTYRRRRCATATRLAVGLRRCGTRSGPAAPICPPIPSVRLSRASAPSLFE